MHTKRLELRALSRRDREAALDLLTDKSIGKTYMLPDFAAREDAAPLFQKLMELSLEEGRYIRGIYLKDYLIGFLNDVEIENGSIELGYLIHPDHQGRGYMTEALRAAIRELFGLGFRRVVAGAFEENAASVRVMIKAGMSKMEKSEDIEYHGTTHHCVYYSVVKDDSE